MSHASAIPPLCSSMFGNMVMGGSHTDCTACVSQVSITIKVTLLIYICLLLAGTSNLSRPCARDCSNVLPDSLFSSPPGEGSDFPSLPSSITSRLLWVTHSEVYRIMLSKCFLLAYTSCRATESGMRRMLLQILDTIASRKGYYT